MSNKYWGLITTTRPHIFSFGSHENVDDAITFGQDFCDRKNEENRQWDIENNVPEEERGKNEYELLWVLDESDMRNLTGEVHRPYIVARKPREEIKIESPVRRAGNATTIITETPQPDDNSEATSI